MPPLNFTFFCPTFHVNSMPDQVGHVINAKIWTNNGIGFYLMGIKTCTWIRKNEFRKNCAEVLTPCHYSSALEQTMSAQGFLRRFTSFNHGMSVCGHSLKDCRPVRSLTCRMCCGFLEAYKESCNFG